MLLLHNSTITRERLKKMLRGWKYRGWDLRGAFSLVGMARLKKVYHTQHTVSKGTMAVSVLANWTGRRDQRKTLRKT